MLEKLGTCLKIKDKINFEIATKKHILPDVMAVTKLAMGNSSCFLNHDSVVNPILYYFKDKNFLDLYKRHVKLCRIKVNGCLSKHKHFRIPPNYKLYKYQYMAVDGVFYGVRKHLKKFTFSTYAMYGNLFFAQYLLIHDKFVNQCLYVYKPKPVNRPYELYGNENPNEHLSLNLKLGTYNIPKKVWSEYCIAFPGFRY
ncbi:unknown [Choristoneura occidentalis granulovirus]|uniref:Uncharacterized protein n=1 Tax=Choristoneura occidentalis granulovirus TaxID=364745 RepID=Q1A4S6_9BBAC|nr:unknown [Choristoneura fumiferana granulovirus]ABC61154.1 unknown [Choristoneura fumiferana granulovirus]